MSTSMAVSLALALVETAWILLVGIPAALLASLFLRHVLPDIRTNIGTGVLGLILGCSLLLVGWLLVALGLALELLGASLGGI